MESWEKELENEILNKSKKIIVKKKSNFFLYFVIIALSFMSIGLLFKKNEKFRYFIVEHFKIKSNKKPIGDESVTGTIVNKDESITGRIINIEAELKKNSQRINNLGIGFNENFSIIEKNNQEKNFIFLNHDWSLNRKPENITVNPEDQSFIDRNIKNQ
jgi:hypothetical protein